jgi:hypothetical protein
MYASPGEMLETEVSGQWLYASSGSFRTVDECQSRRFQKSGCMPVQEALGKWMNASPGGFRKVAVCQFRKLQDSG